MGTRGFGQRQTRRDHRMNATFGQQADQGGEIGLIPIGALPWRWAIGSPDQLTKVDRDGETLWYLMPGKQATVWGAIHMTTLIPSRNPQECWAALIHEDVDIPLLQDHAGPIKVELQPVPTGQ